MIKNTKILSIILVAFFVSSCDLLTKKDLVEPEETEIGNKDVNAWIYERMNEYYLWTEELPKAEETNLALDPDEYFESILVKPGEIDRFSWIQEDSEELRNSLNGVTKVFGINQKPYFANAAQTKVALAITYTSKGGAADRAGIKRGDFITQINGVDITADNYRTALSENSLEVTLGDYVDGEIVANSTKISLTKEVTQLDAIQHSEVIEIGDKKIGYLTYLQFITSSDKGLNSVFAEFKSQNIDELIVDLRYNPGGYISSAEILSSLIVKDLKANMLMSKQVWNSQQTKRYEEQYGKEVFTDYFPINPNNIGTLDRVYFLVSKSSASSSELVINNLKPYMDVVLVGDNTYGKNVGSITIDDDENPKRWNWGMQPIVLKTVNSKGESDYGTVDGFAPDIKISDNKLPFRAFGDPEETLLKAALEDIVGEDVLATTNRNAKVLPTGEFKSLIRGSLNDNPILDRKEMILDILPGQRK